MSDTELLPERLEAPAHPEPTRPRTRYSWGAGAVLVALILMRAWLTWSAPPKLDNLDVDDLLYAKLAHHISEGEWLGPFDAKTLIKAPGYPMFVALNHRLGLPLRIGHELLFVLSTLLFYLATRALKVPRFVGLLIVFGVFLNPGTFGGPTARILRENVYLPQILMVTAGMGMMLGTWRYAPRLLASALTALVAGWMWITREEGPWLIPAFGVFALSLWMREARNSRGVMTGFLRAAILVSLPVLGVVGAYQGVLEANEHHYGSRVFVEHETPEFAAAMGAIMRVEPQERARYEPITKEHFDRLCAVSPTLAQCRPAFMAPGFDQGWMISKENGGRVMNATMFVIRRAVESLGHYKSPESAAKFYGAIASELNAACDDGRIPKAEPLRDSFRPRFRSEWFEDLLDSLKRKAFDVGGAQLRGERQIPTMPMNTLLAKDVVKVKRIANVVESPNVDHFAKTRSVWTTITQQFRVWQPRAFGAAIVALLIMFVAMIRKRRIDGLTAFVGVVGTLLLTRVVMTALIDTYVFPTESTYQWVVYPLFTAFALLPFGWVINLVALPTLQGRPWSFRSLDIACGLGALALLGVFLLHVHKTSHQAIVTADDSRAIGIPGSDASACYLEFWGARAAKASPRQWSLDVANAEMKLFPVYGMRSGGESVVIRGQLDGLGSTARIAIEPITNGRPPGAAPLQTTRTVEFGKPFELTFSVDAPVVQFIILRFECAPGTSLRLDGIEFKKG